MVTGSNDLYLDMYNSRLHVLAKITNTDGSDIREITAGPINLPLYSIFCEIFVEFIGKTVRDSSPLYPYCAYLETLLNYSKEIHDTRLLCKG